MKGKVFVVESGTDGSGKATQTQLLYNRLKMEGYKVRKVTYPNYESDSSALIKMYLSGQFGENPEKVNAYAASTFYAVDRFASYQKEWKEAYNAGEIILADRYTTSNMVHQASKIENKEEKKKFLDWLSDLEFVKMELPVPDSVFFLDMPPAYSLQLMKNRKNKFTGENKKDIHENSEEYLEKTYENATWVCEKYSWRKIPCTHKTGILTIEEIHELIYKAVMEEMSK